MHDRPKVSELFAMNVQRIRETLTDKVTIFCHAVITAQSKEHRDICDKYSLSYSLASNKTLGAKFNAGLEAALDKFDFNYLMIMGDDDIMSPDLVTEYLPYMEMGVKHFGLRSIYMLDAYDGKALKFTTDYPTNKIVGCGRMIRKDALLDACFKVSVEVNITFDFAGITMHKGSKALLNLKQAKHLAQMGLVTIIENGIIRLWQGPINEGLDRSVELAMLAIGETPKVALLDRPPLIVDIKTKSNIWAYKHFEERGFDSVPLEEATSFLSNAERAQIGRIVIEENKC